jgi:superfamily II DNA or RNA helicase
MESTTDLQAGLQQIYATLTPELQAIVQLYALLYQPTRQDTVLKCWQMALGDQERPNSAKSISHFSFAVQKLASLKLISIHKALGPSCPVVFADIAIRDAIRQGNFDGFAKAIAHHFPVTNRYFGSPILALSNEQHALRELRLAIYQQDNDRIELIIQSLEKAFWRSSITFENVFTKLCLNPFDREWFETLSPTFLHLGTEAILRQSLNALIPADDLFELLADQSEAADCDPFLKALHLERLLFQGEAEAVGLLDSIWPLSNLLGSGSLLGSGANALSKATAKSGSTKSGSTKSGSTKSGLTVSPFVSQLWGMALLLQGQLERSLLIYRASLKAMGKAQAKQLLWFDRPAAALFLLALLKDGSPDSLQEAEFYAALIQRQTSHQLYSPSHLLALIIQSQQGRSRSADSLSHYLQSYSLDGDGIALLLEALCLYWLDLSIAQERLPSLLIDLYRRASQAGYAWIAMETAALMAKLQPDSTLAEAVELLREEIDTELSLVDVIERKDAWELSLNALMNLTTVAEAAEPKAATLRLVWWLTWTSSTIWDLSPIEQKFSVKSGWTKGRSIALKRLKNPDELPYLTPQDLKVCKSLEATYYQRGYYNQGVDYEFTDEALLALVGHPNVFWAATPTVRVDLVAGAPELLVKKLKGDRLSIELSPAIPEEQSILALKETPTRIKVIEIQESHRRIAEILGPKNRLEVPAHAQEQVLGAIATISNLVTVQSDIGGGVAAEEVPADATPHAHLLPEGEGLKVTFLVRPFADAGPYYGPGQGGETVIAEVGGKRLQTQRDLKDERKRARAIAADCPTLQEITPEKGEWILETPEECLTLLFELKELGDRVVLEWPEGEKFRVGRQLGLADWKLSLRKQNDWFEASGEVQLGEDQVMGMQQLMALLSQSKGRFVQLADGQFVALTEEFRRRLQDLARFSQAHGKGVRFHGLAAMALDEVVEDVENLKVDRAWKEHIARIRSAQELQPVLPETLQAELRDYQQEGYNWMARLAHWGVGACLADDMGLGKTLQAMAIILSRSAGGPTLVLAPTSVCMNWIGETEKFAPSLNVIVFGSGDRQQVLNQLQPQDLVICSYGLLQQDDVAAMLAAVSWQTIVLDEAQAIKNHATKRSQAAMNLKSEFKVITTGTPIENHLGELWNLFRFINPGLLGSLEDFNERFALPIERDKNEQARDTLRRLIQPFILRRTKDQVLKELPSRTEITLQVDLSDEEMAFYEALRREAIDRLNDSDAPPGQKHLQVLAEIMKLRRSCCNTRLVRPELELPSAKLDQFGEVLTELLDNGHKALVFSQFVDHLSILRDYLDSKKIAYQYLDGSTPAKQRKLRVDAFQQGEGDVFLISLKAGGTGLNLTAADYVIHMDPWWNPAVEDQASDRAHRIGQQRPVTIYRLVARGTIEAKIVDLHQQKRDLADSLLDGTDMSSKVSTAELLRLISNG